MISESNQQKLKRKSTTSRSTFVNLTDFVEASLSYQMNGRGLVGNSVQLNTTVLQFKAKLSRILPVCSSAEAGLRRFPEKIRYIARIYSRGKCVFREVAVWAAEV